MGTTAQKLQAIVDSKATIKEAIEKKGVEVKDVSLSEYAAKIAEIPSSIADLGVDLEAIYNRFPEVTPRIVIELWAVDDVLTISAGGMITRLVTSDGATYTTFPVSHTWNTAKDLDSSIGLKVRWFVVFGIETFYNGPTTDKLHICGACMKISNPYLAFKGLSEMIDSRIHRKSKVVGDMKEMFYACGSLVTIPLFDFSGVKHMSGTFRGCSSLKYIPKINTRNVLTMADLFSGCNKLITIPELDMSSVISVDNMFVGCSRLRSLPKMNTSNCTNFNRIFYGCSILVIIEEIDCSSAANLTDAFLNCRILRHIRFRGLIPISLKLSNSARLDVDSLMSAINALKDLTGTTTQTLTLGTMNLAKLTNEQKAIATAKNWILN